MIEISDIRWCILPDSESSGYDDIKPRKPWLGKVTSAKPGYSIRICSYNPETGSIDDDSNASTYAREEDLFLTEQEARKAYLSAMNDYISDLQNQIAACCKEMGEIVRMGTPAREVKE
jgi:hypothetical protein